MSSFRFLLDENVPPAVRDGLLRLDASMEVLTLGDEGAPPLKSQDPDILTWLAEHDFCLITHNRSSMPGHLEELLLSGRHVRGLFTIPRRARLGIVLDDLFLIWAAAEPDEYADQITYLPLRARHR